MFGLAQNTNSGTDDVSISVKPVSADTSIFLIVERAPEFSGGVIAMTKFIQDNLRSSNTNKESEITGVCYISFVVEKDGSVTHVETIRAIAQAPEFNAECVRVVSSMPKWIPGKQNGLPVRTRFNLPLKKSGTK